MYNFSLTGILFSLPASFSLRLFLTAFMIWFVLFIISGIGFRSMARLRGIEYIWMIWIPFVRLYFIGELVHEKISIASVVFSNVQLFYPMLFFVTAIALFFPVIGYFFVVCCAVYTAAVFCRLYHLYDARHYKRMTVISIIFPFMYAIYPFLLRHHVDREYIRGQN